MITRYNVPTLKLFLTLTASAHARARVIVATSAHAQQGVKQSVLSVVVTKSGSQSGHVGVRANCQTRQKKKLLHFASNRRHAAGSALEISSFVFTTPIDHNYA